MHGEDSGVPSKSRVMVRFRRCFIPICFRFETLGIFPRSRSIIKCEVGAFGEASALQIFGASWVQKGRLVTEVKERIHLGPKRVGPCLVILDKTVPSFNLQVIQSNSD